MSLIIVEGIPGSGKSTTARFIALQSERNGFKTKLYHESAFQHPIFINELFNNYRDWMDEYISNWDIFLKEQTDHDTTVVLESVLYQSPILNLLHMDIDREAIVQFIEEIYSRLMDVNCCLVFLYQDDPLVGINRMMNIRGGKQWLNNTYEKYNREPYYVNRGRQSADLHLDFLHEYAVVARSAFTRCSINSLAIDNTDWDWTTCYNKIVNYFNWSYIPDPVVPESELQKYTGIYHNGEMNFSITIEIKDSQLIIFGDHQLKPKELNKFYLDNISIVVSFIRDHSNVFNQLLIEEKDLVGNQKDEGTSFVRVS